LKDALKIL